jgi:hypothetical protein
MVRKSHHIEGSYVFYGERYTPKGISFKKDLIIDKKRQESRSNEPMSLVCLSLEGTLFKKIKHCERSSVPRSWRANAIEMTYSLDSFTEKHLLLERPGAADLLLSLTKHAETMIYSSQEPEFIEQALLQLSIAQGNPDTCSDIEYDRAAAYVDQSYWSRDQCMHKSGVYLKSLGAVAEHSDSCINDIWLIDHKPNLVDFPSHVVTVPEFTGDADDRELYKLVDRIFVN